MVNPDWRPFNDGVTIGTEGSESGTIVRDQEHPLGARLTLERWGQTAPLAITCGVYGWMVHTRFFASEAKATLNWPYGGAPGRSPGHRTERGWQPGVFRGSDLSLRRSLLMTSASATQTVRDVFYAALRSAARFAAHRFFAALRIFSIPSGLM